MQRLVLKVTEKKMERKGDIWFFSLRGNGLKFEMRCLNHELGAKIHEINESFRNSLRYIKHYAGYPNREVSEEEMKESMDKLSSTNYGLGIRIKEDPLPEFQPFTL